MSEYGDAFDGLADRWAVIEDEHDKIHPNRGRCGGVGGCTMMHAAVGLEQAMVEALEQWRADRRKVRT
jgi:hypothetical protein